VYSERNNIPRNCFEELLACEGVLDLFEGVPLWKSHKIEVVSVEMYDKNMTRIRRNTLGRC